MTKPITLRKSLGISQIEFAELLGVTNTTISRWENDHHEPSDLCKQAMKLLRKAVRTKGAQKTLEEAAGAKTTVDLVVKLSSL